MIIAIYATQRELEFFVSKNATVPLVRKCLYCSHTQCIFSHITNVSTSLSAISLYKWLFRLICTLYSLVPFFVLSLDTTKILQPVLPYIGLQWPSSRKLTGQLTGWVNNRKYKKIFHIPLQISYFKSLGFYNSLVALDHGPENKVEKR